MADTEPTTLLSQDGDGTAVTNDSWTTVASLGPLDYSELPNDGTFWCWFSAKYENTNDNQTDLRVRDVGNGSTLASASPSQTTPANVTGTPASFDGSFTSTLVDIEFQIKAPSGNSSLVNGVPVNTWIGRR